MLKPSFFPKKFWVCYFLTLFVIYPLSPFLFNAFLNFKEPAFLSPIAAEGKIPIRSDVFGDGHFGARRAGGTRRHKGLDIRADIGETVLASKSGAVRTGYIKNGMGKYVRIKHRRGYLTLYGHLSKITAKDNQWIWQGSKIGDVGKTGNANYRRMQPHLHFEIRYKDKHQDPLKYL